MIALGLLIGILLQTASAEERIEIKREFHPGGSLQREFQVRIDADGLEVPHGFDRSWYEDGPHRTAEYRDGKLDGLESQWHANGTRKSEFGWQAGLGQGIWLEWFDNGQLWSRVNMVDGAAQGSAHWWHPNGQRALEAEFDRGRWTGQWVYYHDTGQIDRTVSIDAGTGRYIQSGYFAGGELWCRGELDANGAYDGPWTWWHVNGQVALEAAFSGGERSGHWVYYDVAGQITHEANYEPSFEPSFPELPSR